MVLQVAVKWCVLQSVLLPAVTVLISRRLLDFHESAGDRVSRLWKQGWL